MSARPPKHRDHLRQTIYLGASWHPTPIEVDREIRGAREGRLQATRSIESTLIEGDFQDSATNLVLLIGRAGRCFE